MKNSKIPISLSALLFYTATIILWGCGTGDQNNTTEPEDPTRDEPTAQPISLKSYKNTTYDISLQLPQEWISIETPNENGTPFIANLIPPDRGAESEIPLNVHGDAALTYVSIMPEGLGTEFPSGASATFADFQGRLPKVGFRIDEQQSKVFLLNNGSPWAYALYPADPPASWKKFGFIFAQMAVDNFQATCYDKTSGDEKAVGDCDPMAGDRFVRSGQVRSEADRIIREILAETELRASGEEPIRQLIQVEKPLPNIDVSSPMTIKGKAVGYWYFEGSFPLKLYDARDQLIAEGVAEAEGAWMTEDFVPFEATLEFDAPDDERGELVFQRANPSGKPENERTYALPVIFPPQEQ